MGAQNYFILVLLSFVLLVTEVLSYTVVTTSPPRRTTEVHTDDDEERVEKQGDVPKTIVSIANLLKHGPFEEDTFPLGILLQNYVNFGFCCFAVLLFATLTFHISDEDCPNGYVHTYTSEMFDEKMCKTCPMSYYKKINKCLACPSGKISLPESSASADCFDGELK